MKWKRSKKAQQEAKNGKETTDNIASNNSTTKIGNASLNNCKTTITVQSNHQNNDNTNSTQVPNIVVENPNEINRKMQENESLYRPYVV